MQNQEWVEVVQTIQHDIGSHAVEYLAWMMKTIHECDSIEENNLDLDEGNEIMCDACMLPIFSTPYYQRKGVYNNNDDNKEDQENEDNINNDNHGNGDQDEKEGGHHFLHKCCPQLPKSLEDHPLHRGKALFLQDEFLDDHYRSGIICFSCKSKCKGFFYQCPREYCKFTLDIQCAITIKVVHTSHKHELTLIPKGGHLFTCRACGLEGNNEGSYECHFCNFYLHRDCASLPNTILHSKHGYTDHGHPHHLTLTFRLPMDSFKFMKSDSCFICHEKLSSIESGIYFCSRCDCNAHIRCVISQPSDFRPVSSRETVSSLPHLPMMDEETSLIDYLAEKGCIISNMNTSGALEEKKMFFEHELILHHQNEKDKYMVTDESLDHAYILCDACVQPITISHTFYACSPNCQCTSNHLYLHKSCANLPFNLKHPLHHYIRGKEHCKDEPLVLLPTSSSRDWTRIVGFNCSYGCDMRCNGFLYSCEKCKLQLDVRCAFLPDAIIYELHGKSHILFLSYSSKVAPCNCCNLDLADSLFYRCSGCPNFEIHARCAVQPSSVSHKYDRHPLKLTPYDDESSTLKTGDVDFCEICEESMISVRKPWFYHCKECITLFHINCIPCVGRGSRIKFGGSIRVGCHDCPLTCIRPLNSYSYSCGLCERTIQGKEEDEYLRVQTAFECAKCGFWLDERCAEMNSIDDE